MKISLYSKVGSFLVASLFATSCAQQENMVQTLTPVPVSYQTEQGKFQWDAQTQLFAEGEKIDTSIIETAFQHAPQPIKWTEALPESNFIRLTLVPELKGITSPEGYTLQITSNGIQIEATTQVGLFYGVQSILQLTEQGKGAIQAATITDEPRFEYRGIMLDVSRHFRSKEFVKKQIDKINETASKFRYFAPFNDIFEEAEGAKSVISLNAQFGEGWLLPAEIVSYARQGVNNVVSLQPFGCIANHIVSRGVEKRIKSFYPDINLLSLDFDSGVSDVNITNRMLLFIDNLKNATMNYDNN